jgi:predicted nucleic acid-binding protein
VAEIGSEQVAGLLAAGAAAVCRLTEVEVSSALARRLHSGALPHEEHRRCLSHLVADLEGLHVVEVDRSVAARTHDLLSRHRLRAADAIQLAACLELVAAGLQVEFVAYDDRLNDAAKGEGLLCRQE